jgi:hypothetical protein
VLGFGHSMGTGGSALGATGTEGKGLPAGVLAEAGGNRTLRSPTTPGQTRQRRHK